jgi:hypothetical protein
VQSARSINSETENFYRAEAIPLLGAGKVELKAVRALAIAQAEAETSVGVR